MLCFFDSFYVVGVFLDVFPGRRGCSRNHFCLVCLVTWFWPHQSTPQKILHIDTKSC